MTLFKIELQQAVLREFKQPIFDLWNQSYTTRLLEYKLLWAFEYIWII